MENTPRDHPDHAHLVQAEGAIHNLALKINSVKESKQSEDVQETLKKLELLLITDVSSEAINIKILGSLKIYLLSRGLETGGLRLTINNNHFKMMTAQVTILCLDLLEHFKSSWLNLGGIGCSFWAEKISSKYFCQAENVLTLNL